jgi:AraC-like DNA-binding protein
MLNPLLVSRIRLHVAWAGSVSRGPDPPGSPATRIRQLPRMLLEWSDLGSWCVVRSGRPDVVVGPQDVLVLLPETPHRMVGLGPARWTTCWSLIEVDQGPGIPLLDQQAGLVVVPSAQAVNLRRIMSCLADTGDADGRVSIRLQRLEHGAALVRELVALRPELVVDRTDPRLGIMGKVLAFIELHLGDRLTRDGLARLAGLSPSRFHTVFVSVFGRSPMEHVLHLRLAKACDLLLQKEKTGKEIAACCGFSSHAHFCNLFRSTFGVTTSEWVSSVQWPAGSPVAQ